MQSVTFLRRWMRGSGLPWRGALGGFMGLMTAVSASAQIPSLGNVLTLSGSTDRITAATVAYTATDNFTLEALVKPAALPTADVNTIIHNGAVTAGVAVGIGTALGGNNAGGGSQLLVHFRGLLFFDTGYTFPAADQWYHVAVTRRNGTTYAYVNGVQTPNTTTLAPNAVTGLFTVGSQDGGLIFSGQIDEARAWNVSRTQAEIQSKQYEPLTGTEPGLVAYYNMNRTGAGANLVVTNEAVATGTALDGLTKGTTTTPVFTPSFPILAPTITGFSPASGPIGTAVTLTGTQFSGAFSVKFNGLPTPFTVVSPTSITTTIPAGATTGTFDVTVPGGTATSPAAFVVVPTGGLAFTPSAGGIGSVVLVTGTGFSRSTIVTFNGVAATGTVYNSPTQVTATVPSGATAGPLTATTGAIALAGGTFTVRRGALTPTVQQFSPKQAPVGALVTLTGANFVNVTAVRFGTVNATGFVVNSPTSLTVPVPAGAPNARIYVLTNNAGMAQTASAFTLIAPPTLATTYPAYGTPQALVQLTGTNLTNATGVSFNGTAAPQYVVHSATSLTATIPVGATTGPISVTTVAGTATTAGAFTVNATPAAPSVTGFSPGIGPVGTAVVLTGTSLTGASGVMFGTVSATSFAVNSASQLTATVPAGATSGKVSVLTPGGLAQSAASFTVAPVPTLVSFSPAAGSVGSVVQLKGTNLSGATRVAFGGVTAPVFSGGGTLLTATVPPGAQSGAVTVTTPGGTATSPTTFTVTAAAAPTITGFTPSTGPVGTSVIVTGTNFSGVTQVMFNTTLATSVTVNSTTQLTATVPTGTTTGKIAVLAAGGLALSATVFTVIPAPTISSLTPDAGTRGSTVIVRGANLTGTTGLTFGGAAATAFTVNSATQITVTVPNTAVTGLVTATTVAGTATSPAAFTVTLPPPPTVSAFSPTAGPEGTLVTLTGTNFSTATRVQFNGIDAESFVLTSATNLVVTVPDGATTGNLTVVGDGGLGQSAGVFTVTAPPDITTFSPVRGPVGTVVTVTGTGFTAATGATVGGVAATTFTVNSATKLTLTVPTGAATGQLSLTTAIGTAYSPGTYTLTAMRAGAAVATDETTLAAYPNPAVGQVQIQLTVGETAQALPAIQLFNSLGGLVLTAVLTPAEGTTATGTVSLLGLAPGLYTVRCGSHAQRLLVQQ